MKTNRRDYNLKKALVSVCLSGAVFFSMLPVNLYADDYEGENPIAADMENESVVTMESNGALDISSGEVNDNSEPNENEYAIDSIKKKADMLSEGEDEIKETSAEVQI